MSSRPFPLSTATSTAYRVIAQTSDPMNPIFGCWYGVLRCLDQRGRDSVRRGASKNIRPVKNILLLSLVFVLTACKVAITVPENADVSSKSGLIDCSAGETCIFNVVDIYFDDTFTATPHSGYEFTGWKKMHQSLCGGKTSSCHLYTTDFWGNRALLAYLELDTVFHLQPEISVIGENSGDTGSGGLNPNENLEETDYRNFYGIVWRGTARDNARYAKQMGYGYVANQSNMRTLPEAQGLKFYMINPELTAAPVSTKIDTTKTYSPQERAFYEQTLTWKNESAQFPNNIASGWWFDDQNFLIVYDFQQQAIIESVVELIITRAKNLENPANSYTFAGMMWDVQDLKGDFWTGHGDAGGKFVDLSFWTGEDSCASSNHQHDYANYSDGKAAFYKRLYQRTRQEFNDPKFIGEPFLVYQRWIEQLETRVDALELMPDMLTQEMSGTQFMDDDRIYASGLITRDRVGLSTPRTFEHQENLVYTATAATNGSWYNWFGKFGGDGNMPNYQNVYEVPARLQLIRVIPGWDNLNQVPLAQRAWNGDRYSSPNSYADADVIYSQQPVTNKIFAVFLNGSGRVKLPQSESLVSVMKTDGLFIETDSGMNDIEYANNEIRLTSSQGLGKGYIITTSVQ